MFNDLDRSLENLLKRNLSPDLLKSVVISFDTPDGNFPPSWIKIPAINLFLYDTREKLELRYTEWMWEKNPPNSGILKKPQTQIECSYIITAWTSESTPNHMLEEHRLLSEVMKALLKDRILPKEVLYGSLKDETATIIQTLVLQPDYFRIGEFWQAMGTKPRLAINYQVTLSVDVRAPEKPEEVKEIEFKMFKAQQPGDVVESIASSPGESDSDEVAAP